MPTCKGKIRYRSQLDAKIALTRINRRGADQEMYWYRCPVCRGWHLTKMEQHP